MASRKVAPPARDVVRCAIYTRKSTEEGLEQAHLHRAQVVLIEDKVSGTSLIQDLFNDGFYKVKAITPKGEKALRLVGVSAMIENGLVFLPAEAPWAEDYISEMIGFPGKHDDQVDSTTQALMWIREHGAEPSIITFCRQGAEAERRFREAPTVRLRSPNKAPGTVITIDGHCKHTDEHGEITLPERDARPLRMGGWESLPGS